jgi:hypothetical protein
MSENDAPDAERPVRWVVDSEHPGGHAVPMTDDEVAQLERDRAEFGERERREQMRLTDELHRFLEQPDWAEQIGAMRPDAAHAEAARRALLEFLDPQGIDPRQIAKILRAVAELERAGGDESGESIATLLEAQADELDH